MYVDINAAGCPNTCRHCSADGHLPAGEFFSTDELRAIKREWGALTIRFEPTAHPDFPEIYAPDIAVDHGGWLVTNGFGPARRDNYRDVFEKMRAMGMTTLAFTLHGLQPHHDWFVCRPGAFDDIVLATRRAKESGFRVNWQIYIDRMGIEGIPRLIDLTVKEVGELPLLALPYHRVGGRLWHYEKMRLALGDVKKYRLHAAIADPEKNQFIEPEALTSRAWLEKWLAAPNSDDFKHPYEPCSWPPQAPYETVALRIEKDRKVYFDPMCAAQMFLGKLADGNDAILERLGALPMPPYADLAPDDVALSPFEQEQLHPCGFSLRYREISKKRRASFVG